MTTGAVENVVAHRRFAGERLAFETKTSPKGLRATQVRSA